MFEHSEWIWLSKPAEPDEYADFRVVFHAEAGRRYRLYLSCDSDYVLYCNGVLTAFGQYPDYHDYKVYDSLSLDGALREGENELLITVWYYGADSQTYIRKEAGLIFRLDEDDRPLLCSSPRVPSRLTPRYRQHQACLITSQLGFTFSYDGTAEETPYAPSRVTEGRSGAFYPRPAKKTTLGERLPFTPCFGGGYREKTGSRGEAERMQNAYLSARPIRREETGLTLTAEEGEDGVFLIVDLGRECVGFPELELTAPEDCELGIGWGEHLGDGRCRTAVRNFTFRCRVPAGKSSCLWAFRRLGCRYLQLFAPVRELTVSYLGLRPVSYPLTILPFSTGDRLRDRIYEAGVRTLMLCMHDHYEDCPWREQALYTMDSRNQMLCGYYAFGEYRFPRACLELISHGFRKDGLLSICFPGGLDFPIPSFSLIWILQMREYLLHSGDEAFLREKYPQLKQLLSVFLDRRRENGLIDSFSGEGGYWNFYEWSEGLQGRFNEQVSSTEAPLNAFLSLALQALGDVARRLGFREDADSLLDAAASLNDALRRRFFDRKSGLFDSFADRRQGKYSVLTNSLCLLCGAAEGCPTETLRKVLEANGAADTGLYVIPDTLSMQGFRFDALLAYDRERYREPILRELDEVYGAMLLQGATSFWETAEGAADFGGAGSLCHGWSALPVYYYHILL